MNLKSEPENLYISMQLVSFEKLSVLLINIYDSMSYAYINILGIWKTKKYT